MREQLPYEAFAPLSAIGSLYDRLTFEGKMKSTWRDGICWSYLHFYRNGIIEMVDAFVLSHPLPNDPEVDMIPSSAVEKFIDTGVDQGLQLMRHVGATGPVAVAVTLTQVKGMVMQHNQSHFFHEPHPVLNEHLTFAEVVFSELSDRKGPVLRPLFDLLWNACGIRQAPNFDDDGNWTLPAR